MPAIAAEEVQQRFPDACAFARRLRAVFGPRVRLLRVENAQGDALGASPPALLPYITPELAQRIKADMVGER